MERVTTQRHAEAISHALTWIPSRILEIAGFDVFCGDPLFAGLHRTANTQDGRSYSGVVHVCFPPHVADRRVTVVYPAPPDVNTVIHEVGHALDWALIERTGRARTCQPMTPYAETDRWEAFAESFRAWFWPLGEFPEATGRELDRESYEFFDRLAYGGW